MVNHKRSQAPSRPHPTSPEISESSPSTQSYTFTQIIDADHLTIQTLAAKTRRVLSTIPNSNIISDTTNPTNSLVPLLHEITWRLIRHDLSESLVMRPAFITTLPSPQGQEMADHDARDHANGRILLISVLERLEKSEDLREISEQVVAAFDDLGKHMAIESGEFLPYFETLIDEETSRRLAREYTESLCMTPYLRVPVLAGSGEKGDEEGESAGSKALFEDVLAYVKMDPAELKRMYEDLVARTKVDENLRARVETETAKELDRLQVWKWRSLTASDFGSRLTAQSQTEKDRSTKL